MRSSLFLVLAFAFSVAIVSTTTTMPLQARLFPSGAWSTTRAEQARLTESQRAAHRLQRRVEQRFGFTLSIGVMEGAIAEQRSLLTRSVRVEFTGDTSGGGSAIAPWIVTAERFLRVEVTPAGMRTSIDASRIFEEFADTVAVGIRLPEDATLLSTSRNADGIWRAETAGIAKAGYRYDDDVVQRVVKALETGSATLAVQLLTAPGSIRNESLEELGELALLASGRSDFAGSGEGRKSNVRKGLTKYIHNAMVEPEQEFSINAILKNVPISEWEMALGIFGGGILRPVAGGGLCQVSTTLYRGILRAGFPVTQRSNHSLYVTYYAKYGVGIDSTIFPASAPDLRFINDTGKPLLIQAYVEGTEATVNIYGTPDGRTVRMTGPYFAENAPREFRVHGKPLSSREIAWVRDTEYADGRAAQDVILSRYKSIPRSVVNEYAKTLSTVPGNVHAVDLLRLHAAAEEGASVAAGAELSVEAQVH